MMIKSGAKFKENLIEKFFDLSKIFWFVVSKLTRS